MKQLDFVLKKEYIPIMKKKDLVNELKEHGWFLKREGSNQRDMDRWRKMHTGAATQRD